jgi:hypothetical protein
MAYSAKSLLANWCLIIIPLAAILRVPDDAPVKLSIAPDVCTLGNLSAISDGLKTKSLATITEFKHREREERDRREGEGLGDRWGEKQSVVIPEINNKFIGFKFEMLLKYTHDQGLSWCHGEAVATKDANKKTVKVRWTEEHVEVREQSETIQNFQI